MADEPAGGTFINLAVPPGAEAGVDSLSFEYGSLSFEYGGASLEVLIPPGSVPGDVLRIQVGADGDGDGGDEEGEGVSRPSSSLLDELGGIDDVSPAPEDDDTKTGGLLSELGGLQDGDPQPSSSHKVHAACSADGITTVELGDSLIQENDGGKEGEPATLQLLESTTSAEGKRAEGDGTHGMVWASGTLLAQALTSSIGVQFLRRLIQEHTTQSSAGDKSAIRCLELGSGLGVCGLALAHALASCGDNDFNASVLLTDQGKEAVEILEKNIERNRPMEVRIAVDAASLLWGSSLSPQSGSVERFHLILGSDLLYDTQTYDPLVSTIKQCLHPNGILLLAVRWRKPDLEREFFRKAELEGVEFQLWKVFGGDLRFLKRSPCTLGWREYGDPKCDKSNCYFHQTKIFGKSLAELMEHVESLNDDEYSAFEEAQCQIYIGKWSNVDEKRPSKRQRAGS